MSEHEAILAIQQFLPQNLNVIDIYRRQDKIKGKDNLTFPEWLNNLADSVADKYTNLPINNHVPFTPTAIYAFNRI